MKKSSTLTYVRTTDKKKFNVIKLVAFIILFIVCCFVFFPLLYMILTSFKSDEELISNPGAFFPVQWSGQYYKQFIVDAWNSLFNPGEYVAFPVMRWMGNSLLLSTLTTVWVLLVLTAAAYAFVFLDLKGKKFIWAFLIAWMAVPSVIGFAGSQSIRMKIGALFGFSPGFIYSYFILTSFGGVFSLMLMKSFLESVPRDLIESAQVEGASRARIFWTIVVPLLRSTMLLIGMWTFIGTWNTYEVLKQSLALMGNFELADSWKTLTVGLTDWAASSATSSTGLGKINMTMSCAVISCIPAVIIYALFSNKMIDGIASSGIKR